MYFNLGIQPVNCNINSTSTCISIWAFDRPTAILIQQVRISIWAFDQLTAILTQQVYAFQFRHSTGQLQY